MDLVYITLVFSALLAVWLMERTVISRLGIFKSPIILDTAGGMFVRLNDVIVIRQRFGWKNFQLELTVKICTKSFKRYAAPFL